MVGKILIGQQSVGVTLQFLFLFLVHSHVLGRAPRQDAGAVCDSGARAESLRAGNPGVRGLELVFLCQGHTFQEGFLVERYEVVVAFGEHLLETLDDALDGHEGLQTEQGAKDDHVEGL